MGTARTNVAVDDLCSIQMAIEELRGALHDATEDTLDLNVKTKVRDCTEFIYKDINSRLKQYI